MYATTQSGASAIVKGNAKASEVYKRIIHQDPELRMPLEGDPLTEAEIELIATWIDEGANWGAHWAYMPLKNDIDKFVLYTSYALFNNTRDADVFTESPNYRFYPAADSADLQAVKKFIEEKIAVDKQKQLLDFLYFQEPKIHVHDFDTLVGIGRFADNDNGMSPNGYALRKGIDLTGKNALLLFHKPKTTKHNGVFDIRINRLSFDRCVG